MSFTKIVQCIIRVLGNFECMHFINRNSFDLIRAFSSIACNFCASYEHCMITLSSKPQIWLFHVVVMHRTANILAKICAARAARLFVLF